jgi:hypothetical protein
MVVNLSFLDRFVSKLNANEQPYFASVIYEWLFLTWQKYILTTNYIPVAQIFGLLLSCQWWAENLRIPRTAGKTHTLTVIKKTNNIIYCSIP